MVELPSSMLIASTFKIATGYTHELNVPLLVQMPLLSKLKKQLNDLSPGKQDLTI
jgi:hypothetical protein